MSLNDMFEEDVRKVLPAFNKMEDIDSLYYVDSLLGSEQSTSPQGLDTNQSATLIEKLTPFQFQPHLSLLADSKRVFLDVIGAEGERALAENTRCIAELWGGLDLAIRKAPVVRLISSESFRKERSQVRILKTKSRLIKFMEKFTTNP